MSDHDYAGLQQAVSQDLRQALNDAPAVWAARAEGRGGEIEIPPEQLAEAYDRALDALIKHMPAIAGAAELAYGRVAALEARVDYLIRSLEAERRGEPPPPAA